MTHHMDQNAKDCIDACKLCATEWRSSGLGSGVGRTSPFCGRPRLFFGLAGMASALSFFAMDSRASMAVKSRLMWPMS